MSNPVRQIGFNFLKLRRSELPVWDTSDILVQKRFYEPKVFLRWQIYYRVWWLVDAEALLRMSTGTDLYQEERQEQSQLPFGKTLGPAVTKNLQGFALGHRHQSRRKKSQAPTESYVTSNKVLRSSVTLEVKPISLTIFTQNVSRVWMEYGFCHQGYDVGGKNWKKDNNLKTWA
jgi:hypothetical protein